MPVRPTLLHRLASFLFYCFVKNLGNLREFFGANSLPPPPPWQKIARTPMLTIQGGTVPNENVVQNHLNIAWTNITCM